MSREEEVEGETRCCLAGPQRETQRERRREESGRSTPREA